MGLFDRLFGKIEEPKIEDVVKEALENIDLSDDNEQNEALESENAVVIEAEEVILPAEPQEETNEDSSEVEFVEETIIEPLDEVEVSQEEAIQVEEVESPQVESSYVEDMTSSDEEEEDFNQLQSDETESEIFEEELEEAIKRMTSLMEPLIIVVIGGIVAFVLLSIYLPMFDMSTMSVN